MFNEKKILYHNKLSNRKIYDSYERFQTLYKVKL